MIKSKFISFTYYYVFLFLFSSTVSLIFLKRGVKIILSNGFEKSDFILLVFIFLIFLSLIFINFIKLVNVNKDYLKYYSILNFLGKTIRFKDYKGIYKTTEVGSVGVYDVIYFVDHNNIARHKIMGLYYKNMDEIIDAIPLPVIKKSLSSKEYMKLMFTGRANLSKIKYKKNAADKTMLYLKIFSAITILIFIVGLLIRIFSKIS